MMSFYDYILILVIVLLGTGTAYLKHPRWKAFMMIVPLPFTFASLALGKPLAVSSVIGLYLLLGFYYAVYFFYRKLKLNIVVSILISAGLYCLAGALVLPVLPSGDTFFWGSVIAVFVSGFLLHRFGKEPGEEGSRSSLPPYIKIPFLVLVVLFLIYIKSLIQGFMCVFPMVGVIGAYEARNCLRSIHRQMPFCMMAFCPVFTTIYLLQSHMCLEAALACAWVVYLLLLLFTTKYWLPQKS